MYLPPDSVISNELGQRWGIAKYCQPLGKVDNPPLRIRASRFRGISSFGTIQDPDVPDWEVGLDVCDWYGISKYEPPPKNVGGDAAPYVAAFHAYTDIENIGNFPGIFQEGEEVVVTEKIHGTNCRVGIVYHTDLDSGLFSWQFMAGSHGVRRKELDEKGVRSLYWMPLGENKEESALAKLLSRCQSELEAKSAVIVFGEIFGPGIQDMRYGQQAPSFRIFDISVDGNYVDYDVMSDMVNQSGLQAVPVLYRGPFSQAKMDELVDGPTTVCDTSEIKEPFKGREGIVIKPIKERFDPILGGRTILKYVSVDYHERKNKDRTEDH